MNEAITASCNGILELSIALATLMFSASCIAGSIFLRFFYHKKIAVEYLGWAVLAASVWNITNTSLGQFIFLNPSLTKDFGLIAIIAGPVPLLMFMDEIQKHRYQKIYMAANIVMAAEFLILFVLYISGLSYTAKYRSVVMAVFLIALMLIAVTMSADIKNKKIMEYPFIAAGMACAWAASLVKIISFTHKGTENSNSVLPLGMAVLLLITIIHTIHEFIAMGNKEQQAVSASEAKGRFLANMSHEIRTPINAVLGMNAMILRESTEPQIKEYSMDIQNAGQSLLAIINDILDLSKIESGKLEIIPGEYDFSSFVHDIVNMVSMKATDKGLGINLSVDESLPSRLEGDDIRLRQVLINLLNNAVKYTEKGSVSLSITGNIKDNTASLLFQVEDTGIGIKEEDINKLFAEFERIEEQRNRNVEGTGLGMSITVQLLELMGSRLHVESTYGKGSKFYFTVEQGIVLAEPVGNLEKRIKNQASGYSYHAAFTAPDATVLVVDDNATNRKVFRNLLKETKINIEEAAGGLECLKMASQKHYDVIFLDHMMPDIDGIETLHRLKAGKNLPCHDTPVIALTANAVSGAKEMYLSHGFNSFLSKPVIPEKLEKMLMEYIPGEKTCYEEITETSLSGNIKENVPNLENLPEINGIDWNYAMLFTKDQDMLLSTVNDFFQLMEEDASQLQYFLNNLGKSDAMEQFRIKVHSMKSSAAMAGAASLSGVARMLENAAREERADIVRKVTPVFLEEWHKLHEYLLPYIQETSQGTDAGNGQREADCQMAGQYLELLGTAMEDLDIDAADEIIKQLKSFIFPADILQTLDKLCAAVNNIDTDKALEYISGFKEKINHMEGKNG